MEIKDIHKQFTGVEFESISHVTENPEVEVLSITDKITNKDILRAVHREHIALEVARQWLWEAVVRIDGKELVIPAHPIGNDGIGSLLSPSIRTCTSSTLIRFKEWKKRKHLNVVFNYRTFLTLWSQDVIAVKSGDFLVIGYDTENDLRTMANRLAGRYATIDYWLQSTFEEAMLFTTDHTNPNGITDTLPLLHGAFDVNQYWSAYLRLGHPMPKYECCARCALFLACKPKRSRWHIVCKRYKPVNTDGEPTDKGKKHIIY